MRDLYSDARQWKGSNYVNLLNTLLNSKKYILSRVEKKGSYL